MDFCLADRHLRFIFSIPDIGKEYQFGCLRFIVKCILTSLIVLTSSELFPIASSQKNSL
jgi:hypothetical protein